MRSFFLLPALLGSALLAQQTVSEQVFRATVNVVVAPVTVTDKDGGYIHGLQPQQFRLYDNGKAQDIKVDVSFVPVSLVVAVQADRVVETILPKVKKAAPLLKAVVAGEQGEVALIAFDHRIRPMQDFTADSDKIVRALEQVRPGSSSSRIIDATTEAIRMLARRPESHRRVLLLISETRDKASEGRVRDALTSAQIHNVLIYTVNINRLVTTFTAPSDPGRPDPLPPGARPLPGGVPPTPDTVRQSTGYGQAGNVIPLFVEIFRQTKSIFIDNPAEVFTEYTGGREYSFGTQRGLEEALSKLSEELRSQYIVSYTPNNKIEGGFHEIKVEIAGRRDIKVLTRPGYWMAAVPE
jgi:VWFA-related protein